MAAEINEEFNKAEYIEQVREGAKQFEHVVIYGAGRKAVGLYNFLKENGISIKAFYVTDKSTNKEYECGLKIYGTDEKIYEPDSTLVLIGVRKRWNEQVIECLEQNGYRHYIEAPDKIEYLLSKDMDRSKRKVLQITAQIGCRIDCKYCPQKLFIRRYTEDKVREYVMTLELFKRYVDNTESDVIIDFAGFSEPLFNNECVEMILYAHEKGHEIELFTTLEGLTVEQFERIRNIPFREVVLHIPDVEVNSKINITKEYIELLKIVIDTNKPNGLPFADWASCHGQPAEEIRHIVDNKLRIITQLHDRAGNLDTEEVEQLHGLEGKIQCSGTPNYDHNVLLPDGTVLLCDSDWGMQNPIGNLKEQTYEEILSGKVLAAIKAKAMDENDRELLCRNCCYAVKI